MITMPDTGIDWVDQLGKYQQELLVFTDCKGRIIGDGYVDLTVLNRGGDEHEAPLKIENENNLNYQEDQEEVHPKQ